MGKPPTGAQTCESAITISLSSLIKSGFLIKGKNRSGTMAWGGKENPTHQIKISSCWEPERYIRLKYSVKNSHTDKVIKYDYLIDLVTVPSNLGKGEVLYFVCPETGKRCRILYLAYGSHMWKSREAYDERLYYVSQISSKLSYANDRYWAYNRMVEKLEGTKHFHDTHKGKPTRKAIHLLYLKAKEYYWERERWRMESLPHFLRKSMKKHM